MDARELKAALAALVRAALPEISGALWPVRARIVRVHEAGGDESDESPRYAVDVQILRPDGSDDETWPEIPKVDLPQIWAGPDVGVWCTPDVGMLVRINWEYGDRSRPYIETLLGIGGKAPRHPAGSLVVKAGEATIEVSRGTGGAVGVSASSVRLKGKTKVVIESDVMVELGAEGGSQLVTASLVCPFTTLPHGVVPPAVPGQPPVPALGLTTKVKGT